VGAATAVGLMIVFLALCVVMRAIAFVLSWEFERVIRKSEE
jgi:hypothetical protein